MTLQGVVDVERQLGGILIDCSKQILFQFNGGNLSLSVDHISYGWRLKQTTTCQVHTAIDRPLHTFVNEILTNSIHNIIVVYINIIIKREAISQSVSPL